LSLGGIGPTTHQYGAQVDNVEALMQIDDLTDVENFSITTGPFPPLPHPAISVVLPASATTQWIESVLPRLNEGDPGCYSVAQIFSWRASQFRRPLMRIPAEEKLVVGFALIRYAANAAQGLLAAAKRCFDSQNVRASDLTCSEARYCR
jgi:hypothetical protein